MKISNNGEFCFFVYSLRIVNKKFIMGNVHSLIWKKGAGTKKIGLDANCVFHVET